MKQIFSVLKYCQRHQVVHRDLKPENIIFDSSKLETGIKVIDFGRSKILKSQCKLKELAGSVMMQVVNV
jgi:calcium-dependent protein kinase